MVLGQGCAMVIGTPLSQSRSVLGFREAIACERYVAYLSGVRVSYL